MKKHIVLVICLTAIFTTLKVTGQNSKEFWLEFKDGYDIGTIIQEKNDDQTLCIDISDNFLENFLNNQNLYKIKKAFPTSTSVMLQRVYVVSLDPMTSHEDFLTRPEIENFVQIEDTFNQLETIDILASSEEDTIELPNDYIDLLEGGPNAALDLIKAPLAWKFSTGKDVLIGISDSSFDQNHPELAGQIIDSIQISKTRTKHGTSIAGVIAANTNNGIGISSIAHHSKLVIASTNAGANGLMNGLLQLSQYPGVRVVNCSWVICERSNSKKYLDEIFKEVVANNVLVVAAAGNKHCGDLETYAYPASYDASIGVTSVGHRFFIGEKHNIKNKKGTVIWERSWKDCYNGRPDVGQGGAHRNDKVNVCAPGQLVTAITDEYEKYPTGYRLNTATSTAAAFVTGLAALIFSIDPELTAKEVKDIIETTADDIYYIPYNQPYIGQLGTGRINAYRAALNAYCGMNPNGKLDLAMQNSYSDDFSEPDVTSHIWQSKDIWMRNQDDGRLIPKHQNPKLENNNSAYVYIRVTNNSCITSNGNDTLKVYWAKDNASLSWPESWDSKVCNKEGFFKKKIRIGNEIDNITIPPLAPGETIILSAPWKLPHPDTYTNIDNLPSNFCLLARIESSNDPMSYKEGNDISKNIANNNNIAGRKIMIIDPNSK